MTSLRVLTYNVGLLRVAVAGHALLEVPYLEARLAHLVATLREDDADVLCLQEVFRPEHRDRVVDELRVSHPYIAREDDRTRGWTHGLLVASRHPLLAARFRPFRAQHWWQRGVVRQGMLSASVVLDGGDISVVAVHTTAGGRRGPEAASVERMRDRQLAEAAACVRRQPHPTLLCGDLNCGPEASAGNFRALLGQGLVDSAPTGGPTWDPRNALNRVGPFRDSPAQRVDHVLLDPRAAAGYRVAAATVVHAEPVVPTPAGRVTLSDHSGVLVDLEPVVHS